MTNPSREGVSPEEWSIQRWKKFQALLQRVRETNAFQIDHFPGLADCDQWSGFDEFAENCPFTEKNELALDRQQTQPYGTNLTFPVAEYSYFHQTSGTMGEPMAWLDTEDDWSWMLGNWDRVLAGAGVQSGNRCFFAFSFGPFLGFWTAYDAARKRGCLCIPGGGQGSEQRLHSILGHKVEYLFCTPTYALRLPEVAKQAGIDLGGHSLRAIVVAGETGGSEPSFRRRVSEAWGRDLRLYDHYGMTEVGPVAFETPGGQGGLRVILESYFAEVIDLETKKPSSTGEGELVLTTLGRTGCPLLRYRTGDLVRAKSTTGPEGFPTLDLEAGILGRSDDMVVIRGVNVYPSSVDAIVRGFEEVAEYQVIHEKKGEMSEIRLQVEAPENITQALEVSLKDAFSLRIPVGRAQPNSLPRFEMKAKRWRTEQ
ncbi:AMP-binding protein [Verrucomicrobia bacterium]|nr:AMP-binding protein [Verrucomicrobiota bacterium]